MTKLKSFFIKSTLPLRNSSGFTLIEMIIVIGVTGLLLLIITAIYANVVQSNVNATVTNDVRANGQYMLETMVRSIRGADIITVNGSTSSSVTTSSTITVTSVGSQTTFNMATDRNLYMNGAGGSNGSSTQLNTSSIQLGSGSQFEVIPASGTAPTKVIITLILSKVAPDVNHTEYGSAQTMTQLVELRKYVR